MNLVERSQSIVDRLKAGEKLPLNLRAAQAVVLVPETVGLLADLCRVVETLEARLDRVEKRNSLDA